MMNVTALAAMPVHEAAQLFPMMEATEKESGASQAGPLTRLASDMEVNGCHTPVVLFKGNVLDGRNRIAAAKLAKLDFLPTTEYTGEDPLRYVLSLNLHRRQLTKSQLVELAIKLLPAIEEKAAENELTGVSNDTRVGRSTEAVAEALGNVISATTISRGMAVAERSPDLWRQVQSGARSISDAYSTMQGPPVAKPSPKGEDAVVIFDSFYDKFMDALDRVFDAGLNDEQVEHVVKMCSHLSTYATSKGGKKK